MPLNNPVAIATVNPVIAYGFRAIIEYPAGTFNAFAVMSIDHKESSESDRIDHSEAPGWRTEIIGNQMWDLTVKFFYDFNNKPHILPWNIRVGQQIKLHQVLDANPTPGIPTPLYTQDYSGTYNVKGRSWTNGPSGQSGLIVTAELSSTGVMVAPTT